MHSCMHETMGILGVKSSSTKGKSEGGEHKSCVAVNLDVTEIYKRKCIEVACTTFLYKYCLTQSVSQNWLM